MRDPTRAGFAKCGSHAGLPGSHKGAPNRRQKVREPLAAARSHQAGHDQLERHWNSIGRILESNVALSAFFGERRLARISGLWAARFFEIGSSHIHPQNAHRTPRPEGEALQIAATLIVSISMLVSVEKREST